VITDHEVVQTKRIGQKTHVTHYLIIMNHDHIDIEFRVILLGTYISNVERCIDIYYSLSIIDVIKRDTFVYDLLTAKDIFNITVIYLEHNGYLYNLKKNTLLIISQCTSNSSVNL